MIPIAGLIIVCLLGLCVALGFPLRRSRAAAILEQILTPVTSEPPEPQSRLRAWAWPLAGMGMLLAALAFLEIRQPYFFVQDDVLVLEMPVLLENFRTVWSGHWPRYVPELGMGIGTGPSMYPPFYVAYALARNVLRDPYAFLDVSAILHLIGGYWATYVLARRIGQGRAVATLASLSFILSGSVLIMGRSWSSFSAVCLWQPLFLLLLVQLTRKDVGWRWPVGVALVLAMYYYAGFPQTVIIALWFTTFCLVWLVACQRIPLWRLRWLIPAGVLTAALCMPLAYGQLQLLNFGSFWTHLTGIQQVQAATTTAPSPDALSTGLTSRVYGHGVTEQLLCMFLPYPLASAKHPDNWGDVYEPYYGQLVYFGTTMAVLAVAAVLLLAAARPRRATYGRHVWTAAFLFGLLWVMGDDGGVWNVLSSRLNIAHQWHYPWRALPQMTLLAVLSGGLLLEGILRVIPQRIAWQRRAVGLTLLLLLCQVSLPLPGFYMWGFRPYPPLPPEMRTLLFNPDGTPTGRWHTISPFHNPHPEFWRALTHNLPSVYGVPAVTDYDPLNAYDPMYNAMVARISKGGLAAVRQYGIRWVFVCSLSNQPTSIPPIHYDDQTMHTRLETPAGWLLEVDGVKPLAYVAGAEDTVVSSLPCFADTTGICIPLPKDFPGGMVVANYLNRGILHPVVDGRDAPFAADSWDRMAVNVPRGATELYLAPIPESTDAYKWAGICAALAMALCLGLMGLDALLARRRKLPTNPPVAAK